MRIMFVCHGNICRSPMAEFIFRRMLSEGGREGDAFVASSATSSEEIIRGVGNPVYPPAAAILKRHGIECKGKRARQLSADDYSQYDLFIGMDRANYRNMHKIFGADPEGKIRLLMDYTDRPGDVADPWYTDNFELAYRDIFDGCTALYDSLFVE